MATIGSLLSAALHRRTQELADAGTTPARKVARRIAMSARNRSLVAVLVVGALASAAPLLHGDETVTPVPDPSPTADGPQTVTVPLDASTWDGSLSPTGLECGDAAPPPNASDSGFSLETTVTRATDASGAQGDDAPPTLNLTLTYTGDEIQDAIIGDFDVYALRDGKVVAMIGTQGTTYLEPGMYVPSGFRLDGPVVDFGDRNTAQPQPCEHVTSYQSTPLLEAGTYEIVVVQRVKHTPEMLAMLDLSSTMFTLTGEGWGLWQPGSIDCREAVDISLEGSPGQVPVPCDPIGAKALGIEITGDQVSLPYEARSGAMDLDVTLVSERITWVLSEDLYGADLGWDVPVDQKPAELACDTPAGWWHPSGVEGWTAAANVKAITVPAGVPLAMDIKGVSGAQQGTIELGSPAPAWLVRLGGQGTELVGEGSATFAQTSVTIDRAKDYGRTTVEVADLAICPGQEDASTDRGAEMLLVVAADAVVEGDDGSRGQAPYVVIELGQDR